MPLARYRLVDTNTTPYYHCISRCVRRAFLCGVDRYSDKNFDHRKQWILDKIKFLSEVFAIEVCAYAIMSNHFHLVLYIDVEQNQSWSADEVLDRWLKIFKGPELARRSQLGDLLSPAEQASLSELIEQWRERMGDLSWYMRCLNESIARMANAEDDCTGRFWDGRFRSQALLDEAALFSCMAYVDLNPIRAGLSRSLDKSAFTSIQERLAHYKARNEDACHTEDWLKPLAKEKRKLEQNKEHQAMFPQVLPIEENCYFELVDWTGRAIREDKRGAIPANVKPILEELGVKEEHWVTNTQYFGSRFPRAIGRLSRVRRLVSRTKGKWFKGTVQAQQFYR